MLNAAENKKKRFWVATHSPILFAPQTLEELEQALFCSSPEHEPAPPDLSFLKPGERKRMSRMFLRLDAEKWMLAHAKIAVLCEGIYDKAIIRKVLARNGIDLARRDVALLEAGGHSDFFSLSLLCTAIDKPAYYVADLDIVIRSPLLDQLTRDRTPSSAQNMLRGFADSPREYLSKRFRPILANLVKKVAQCLGRHFMVRSDQCIRDSIK